jgi:hypothetical protein
MNYNDHYNNMDHYSNMMPELCCSPMAQYPAERLEDMYPDTHRIVYPIVQQVCISMDTPNNPEMHPYPTRTGVERMTDEIYKRCCMEMNISEDDDYWGDNDRQFGGYYGAPFYGSGYGFPAYGGFGFGRRRFLRDLVGILLINQLLRRRGIYY